VANQMIESSAHALSAAVDAARGAGALLRNGFGQAHSVRMKGPTDPVTEMDRAAEEYILRVLRAATPDCGFLAEESGLVSGKTGDRWIVDPLDGTVNYSRGSPWFCVSIALERAGELEVGVVYDPLREDLYAAQRGVGATLNDRPIRVRPTESLASALLSTGFPYDAWSRPEDLGAEVGYFARRVMSIRSTGSAALDLAAVAAGHHDAHWEAGLSPYDMAAGILLVREAGGQVSDFAGRPNALYGSSLIAASPAVHAEMLAYLKTRPDAI
jgi:myo-inositol-1(or 4)-monophosphatase